MECTGCTCIGNRSWVGGGASLEGSRLTHGMPFCRDGAKVPQVCLALCPPPRYQSLDTGRVRGRVGARGRCVHRQKVIGITSSAWCPRHHLALYRFSVAPPSSCLPASARPGLLPSLGREGGKKGSWGPGVVGLRRQETCV